MARRLASEEGILMRNQLWRGCVCSRPHRQRTRDEGQDLVVVLPDSGERYLTSALF